VFVTSESAKAGVSLCRGTSALTISIGRAKAMEDIIRLQRATVDEHIIQENAHNWSAVYDTFAPDGSVIDAIVITHPSAAV
jgi:hypothetical protein